MASLKVKLHAFAKRYMKKETVRRYTSKKYTVLSTSIYDKPDFDIPILIGKNHLIGMLALVF